jgi:DNA polymerase-4
MLPVIFHIDMDSYFATVEQQANPHLRGKAVVVSGKEGSRTVIVAASKEAKKYGVKTAMPIFEAKKLCPHIYFVFPDGAKYQETTEKFINIFKRFTEKVEIYSIDEAFLDLTGYAKDWISAKKIGQEIKDSVRSKVGDWVTCSVGIAKNKLLAKLASNYDKPDGLVVINDKNKFEILDSIKPTDLWGLGPRIMRRLDNMGVTTIPKLRHYPLAELIKEFGPYYGQILKDMSNGEYHDPVVSYLDEPEIKSVGRSYTLPYNTFDKKQIFQVLLFLSERCGRRLRQKKLAGKTLQYYVRYEDFTHAGVRLTLRGYINDDLILYKTGVQMLADYRLAKAVRLVGIRVTNLVKNYTQLPLWLKDRKRFQVIPYLDEINEKYGKLTIKSGFLLNARRLRHKVGGFKYDSD